MNMLERTKSFYEHYDEDGRLFRDNAHLPEYLTTIRYFDLLFPPHSKILDACAGTGRYSFYLANRGHMVTACDLVEQNIDILRKKPDAGKLAGISICNALDLSQFKKNSYDIVLCMGALYHLDSDELREKAVSESVRVCKPGGKVALAYIVDSADRQTVTMDDIYKDIFFGSDPGVIEEIAVKSGLAKLRSIGTDGIVFNARDKLKEASPEEFVKLMEYHYSTCEDENVIRASGHGLWIGKKHD